ncbi:MAG: signal peptide peptidase SppA [Saprospiraceae bacterium]
MSTFWKIVFGSCLGSILAGIAVFFIGSGIIGIIASGSDKKEVKNNSVLAINMSPTTVIPEKTNNTDAPRFDLKNTSIIGLSDLVKTLEIAKNDPDIKGIKLEMEGLMAGQATTSVLRKALEDFRSSGKFIVSYGVVYTQKDYFLASVSDKLYIHPNGMFDFRGYGSQLTFFKNMLDKLDIKVQVFYAGQFKSATEPFRYDKMSDPNRLQVREYLTGLYNVFLESISKSRNIPAADLRKYADGLMIRNADDAVKYHLVDAKAYKDEFLEDIKSRVGVKDKEKVNYVSLDEYYDAKVKDEKGKSAKDKIAVVYAEGTINMSKKMNGEIGGEAYSAMLRKIRQDENIKAIVLRVNSGGGSSLASEDIWRELQLAKQAGKKVVVSMGDVAASGGYYISTPADTIFAEPNTITGSIGVFGLVPGLHNTMKNKLGITFDTVRTGRFSTGFSLNYDFNPEEQKYFQENVDHIYDNFLGVVAEGRKMSKEQVNVIAQGRVWTGTKAKEIGLVDRLGNLQDAIACASRMAGISTYKIKEYPASKEPIQQFIDEIMGNKDDENSSFSRQLIRTEMGTLYPYFEQIKSLQNMSGIQMRMPYMIEIK